MTEIKFSDLWRDCILPAATQITKQRNLTFDFDSRPQIEKMYESNRAEIRKAMQDPSKRIDRHKVASSLTYAIMRIAPIKSELKPGMDIRLMLGNELLAMAVGLKVISAFIRNNPECSTEKKAIFVNNRMHEGLKFDDGSSYVEYFCRSITRIRLFGITPDTEHLMLLSHLYYYLERVHELILLGHR